MSEAKQAEIQQLYDVEKNKFSKDREEEEGLELVPIAVHGEFVEELNSKRREWTNNDYWRQGFVEYVMNQDDRDHMKVFLSGGHRLFHLGGVCMAHPKAKKALKRGFREHSLNKVRKLLVEIFCGNEAFFKVIAKAMAEKNNEVSAKKITQSAYVIL